MRFKFPGAVLLVLASVVHLIIGISLVLSSHVLVTTPTAIPLKFLTQDATGLLYLAAAGFAHYGFLRPGLRGALYTVPQMALLYVAAISAVGAIAAGVYPDGTVTSMPFILADQSLTTLFAVAHGACVVLYHGHARWKASSPS